MRALSSGCTGTNNNSPGKDAGDWQRVGTMLQTNDFSVRDSPHVREPGRERLTRRFGTSDVVAQGKHVISGFIELRANRPELVKVAEKLFEELAAYTVEPDVH